MFANFKKLDFLKTQLGEFSGSGNLIRLEKLISQLSGILFCVEKRIFEFEKKLVFCCLLSKFQILNFSYFPNFKKLDFAKTQLAEGVRFREKYSSREVDIAVFRIFFRLEEHKLEFEFLLLPSFVQIPDFNF